jgi:tungstate transport system substrate-binding protein
MRWRVAVALLLVGIVAGCARTPRVLTLATTTSVGNSGLLDALLPGYERQARVVVRPHLVGSGRALVMLASGQADVAVTHAPAAEATALREHPSWRYAKVMFNDFVFVGPDSDPAGVRGAADAADAARRIARSASRFISRGDQSGTHEREQALWKAAGAVPTGDRLVVAGAGMGATLRIAGETGSYTLTDRATYAQQTDRRSLAIVYENDASLLNTYAVVFDPGIPLASDAKAFMEWLTDGPGRGVIDRYRVGAAVRAFELWPLERPRTSPADLPR